MPGRCPVHADVDALTSCHSCGRGLCGACWRHDVNGAPWCEGCVAVLDEPVPLVAYLFVAAVALGGLALGLRAWPTMPLVRWGVFAVGALAIALATWKLRGRAAARRARVQVRERAPTASPPARDAVPYRGGARVVRRLAPPVSGALATLVVGSVMALTAGAIPTLLRLPRWLELEVVVAAWWAIWALTFTVLLFRGWRVAQDVRGLRSRASPGGAGAKRSTLDWGSLDLSGGADLDGCVVLIGLLLALGAAWLLAELFVPLLLFVAYWLILKGLTSVANDRHACEGRLPLAILWGVLWATLYTAPLAGLVALARWILTRS